MTGDEAMTRWRRGALVLGFGLALAGAGAIAGRIEAQEPAPAGKPVDATGRRKHDAGRRVPAYFGQIGLTTEQRAQIYTIQSRRQEAIEALEQQIAREKAEMLVQCESTLTETQRKLLDNLRRAAVETGSLRPPDASSPR